MLDHQTILLVTDIGDTMNLLMLSWRFTGMIMISKTSLNIHMASWKIVNLSIKVGVFNVFHSKADRETELGSFAS